MQFLSRSPLRRASIAVLPLLAAAALGACGKPNFKPETASAVTVSAELPEPGATDLYGQSRETRIGPGDKLAIAVLGVSDLERTVVVDGSGAIQFPLIGRVEALGQTPVELGQTLEQRLSAKFLQNPQVSVSVTEAVSQRFTIYGGVARPGIYPVVGDATLSDAVSLASGTSDSAKLNEVVVFRTVDGQRMAARYDLREISGGRAKDPSVFPGDRIVVGNNSTRSLLRDIAPLTPILGIFYQIL